jgi:hypothetical protein
MPPELQNRLRVRLSIQYLSIHGVMPGRDHLTRKGHGDHASRQHSSFPFR